MAHLRTVLRRKPDVKLLYSLISLKFAVLTWYRSLALLSVSTAESFAFKAGDLMSTNDGIVCIVLPSAPSTTQALSFRLQKLQVPGGMKDASVPGA